MTAPSLRALRADAAAGRPVSLLALSRAAAADRAERSQALADLADLARQQGLADGDGPDHDADPWG